MLKHPNQTENKVKGKVNLPFEEQRLITDLVAELAISLNDKAKLESENANLKLECQELKHKLLDGERVAAEEKNRLVHDVQKSKEIIQEKEMGLAKKDVENLEMQKKYLLEIKELKAAYKKQHDLFEKTELDHKNKISNLEATTSEVTINYNTVKRASESFHSKYLNYKSKVKYAVGIINNLTTAFKKCNKKSVTLEKECQTDATNRKFIFSGYEDRTSLCSLHSQCAVHSENVILTELFFKQHPSNTDLEDMFFVQ